jgi:hypothetical protein
MTNFEKVGHFMKTFGQEIKTKPDLSTEKINKTVAIAIHDKSTDFKWSHNSSKSTCPKA